MRGRDHAAQHHRGGGITFHFGRGSTVHHGRDPALARRNAAIISFVMSTVFLFTISFVFLVNGILINILGLIIAGAINLFLAVLMLALTICRVKRYSRIINAVPRPVPTITTTVPGYGFATEQTATQNQTNTSMVGNAQTTYPYQNNTIPSCPVSSPPYPSQPPYPASTQPYPSVNNDESAPAYTFSTPFAPPPSYESVTKEN